MMKLFPGKHFFVFFASVFITVFVGFFAWSAVMSVGGDFVNKILSYADKISAEFFPASILQKEPQIGDIISDVNLASYNDVDEAPAEEVIQNPPIIEGSRQDLLDDIQEKLDIIQSQVNALLEENGMKEDIQQDDQDADKEDQDKQEEDKIKEAVVCTGQININTALAEDLEKITGVGPVTAQKIIQARPFYSFEDLLKVSGIGEKTLQKIIEQGCAYIDSGLVPPGPGGTPGGGGGGSAPVIYPKILISEVQIAGGTDEKQEFVELYNPNNTDVSLTDWYLQKQTSSGNVSYFGKKSLFSGQKIFANGYFLIARAGYFSDLNPLSVSTALSDNSSLIFRNPNDGISDEVSWSQIPAGLSWGRKWDSTNNTEQDFEIDTPTSKTQNTVFVPPDITAPIITLNSTSEITIDVGDVYNDAGATALDDIDGDVTANIIAVNPVDANTTGDYIITYNVSDAAGNDAVEVTRSIHVVAVVPPPPSPTDITPPTGTIIINDGALYVNNKNVTLNLSASDVSGVVQMRFSNGGAYSEFEPYADTKQWALSSSGDGDKTVRVKFTDGVGNENSPGIPAKIILDTAPPIITLNGDDVINLNVSDTYQELGAAIADVNSDVLIIGGDTVDTSASNTFYITYDTVDLAGNSAIQVIRTVIVNEIEN